LKDFSDNQLGEKQKENRSYMQDIRKKLGEKLGRGDKSISQFELAALIGKNTKWSDKIEAGRTQEIQPKDRIKLDSLLGRHSADLKLLLDKLKNTKKDPNSFGIQLSIARKKAGYITIMQLLNEMNNQIEEENIKVSPMIISSWETNKRVPSDKRYRVLQKILGSECSPLSDISESAETDSRRPLRQEEEKQKKKVTGDLQAWLGDRNDEKTKDEYINELMGL
jgi:ribosome-binding protein aMBF1 (putative translation factor)